MPIDVTENSIRIRQRMPGDFEKDSFRTINITDGVQAVIGRLKGEDTTTVQTYIFDREKFTLEQAKEWVKEHGGVVPKKDHSWVHTEPMEAHAKKTDDGWVLEVLGVPFGGPMDGKDFQGEYFDKNTDIAMEIGEERPVFYYHGEDPKGRPMRVPQLIGKAKYIRKDERGHWFEVRLNKAKKYAQRIWKAAIKGIAKASSGAINYLTRKDPDGRIRFWPVGEITLLDEGSVKALFDEADLELPEAYAKACDEHVEASAAQKGNDSEDEAKKIATMVAALVLELAERLHGGNNGE